MTRALFLTKYDRSGASSRYRSFQYLPAYERAGIECAVSPLFDDTYLSNKYRLGQGKLIDVVRALVRRLRAIARARRFDVVVVEYELLAYFPALFERLLKLLGSRVIVDYDDALFHQYDQHPRALVRQLLGEKIGTVMRSSDLVVVGNRYLAAYAESAGANRVEVVPTVVDLMRYPATEREPRPHEQVVGWIGSPSTAKYLQRIAPALQQVCGATGATLRLIGSGPIQLPGVEPEIIQWKESEEVARMTSCDLGIMPLPDEAWARGKCGFKLIQYMACGLPVVASPVGVNREIVEHGVNGFLAETFDEWVVALRALLSNPALRESMGAAGRRKVEREFCLQVTAPRMVNLVQSVVGGR